MEVARRLRSCVRHSDQVLESSLETVGVRSHRTLEAVGRLGGDEFVALLPEVTDERDAERVAERILEVMRQPIIIGMQECFVTASVGIALFPRDGGNVADLLRNSDVAMYSVKSTGRNSSSLYRPSHRRPGPREARARERPAQGDRARRAGALLPAEDRRARRAHGRRRGADALAPPRRAGAAGRLHPAGRGDRPDHPALASGRSARPRARRGSGRTTSASPTRSPSTCRAGCSSAPTWSSTSTPRSPPTACRTTRSSSRSPRRA